MNLLIWAAAEFHGDSQTLSELAKEGTHGVEIAMIAALVIMSCFFLWVISHREAKREKEVISLEIERNKSLGDLTNAIKEYSWIADRKFELLRHDVADVAENVGEVHSDLETIRSKIGNIDVKVDEHDHRIDDAERLLTVHDKALETLDVIRPKRKKGDEDGKR